jgi:hypothetical protein
MDLPALAGQFTTEGTERQPVARAVALPAVRQLLPQCVVESGAALALDGEPMRGVVELPVGVAEDGVTLVHPTPSAS